MDMSLLVLLMVRNYMINWGLDSQERFRLLGFTIIIIIIIIIIITYYKIQRFYEFLPDIYVRLLIREKFHIKYGINQPLTKAQTTETSVLMNGSKGFIDVILIHVSFSFCQLFRCI
jgi:hypothetical protein